MKQVTLLFLHRNDQILLAMKKRGFGAGKWNGVGGKVEKYEPPASAALRECQEEIGVMAHTPTQLGRIRFFDPDDPEFEHDCHIFVTHSWTGNPRESEEMRPRWFGTNEIPYQSMWPADKLWLPHLLQGKVFEGTVTANLTGITNHHIEVKGS